jgi:hypothetical protein
MHNARVLSLASRNKNSTIQDPELNDSANSIYQSGHEAEEDEQSEAFNEIGNPYVDPANLTRGTRNKYVGAQPREKVQLPQAAWDRASRAINGTDHNTNIGSRANIISI